jgi:hypothetical protein
MAARAALWQVVLLVLAVIAARRASVIGFREAEGGRNRRSR